MIPALPWFDALPRWAKRTIMAGGVLVAVVVAWSVWLHFHDQKVIEAHDAKIDAQVSEQAAEASEAATEAVTETKTRVEAENDDARKAADAGDDPLADGLRSLRGARSPSPAAH